jgi:class 3 adenylate cyclase/tetratricopeptide (TPR) repeat protein
MSYYERVRRFGSCGDDRVEAERRQLVILFADVVGFTAFSERFGEEAAFGLMQNLSQFVERVVQVEGARIQNILGDGVMVAFGAPVAYEDAPLRACRAALSILANLTAAWVEIEAKYGVRPEVRIGINAGSAVFGRLQAGGEIGLTVLGDTVNVAARIESLAAPGTVLMSESAYRLVEGLVDATFVGEHSIKGRAASEKVYRLSAIRASATRFDASLSRGLTAFVGRDRELDALEQSFAAIGATVQVVDIVGEAGIGKTRLLHEFRAHAAQVPAWMMTVSCTSDGQETPFRAFIDLVRGAFHIALGDDATTIKSKLNEGLRSLRLDSDQNLGLLLNLIGHEPPRGALSGLDGVLIGLRTRELLRLIVQARAGLEPLILLFEDIHWVDSASEALLASLVAIEEPMRLLILHTRRPTYTPPWANRANVTRLALNPLSVRETFRIAEARLGVDKLPEALGVLIADKAEGNALFAEEIVNFLVGRGVVKHDAAGVTFDAAAVSAALPQSIQSILASRVDQMPPEARSLLQTAAVIGRRFDPHVVLALAEASNREGASFSALEAADLIYRDELSGDYLFKHILVREAIYNRLLSGPRAATHLKVAEELERRSGNSLIEKAESLAYHFAAGEDSPKAFSYLAMAARKSLNVYAIPEAEGYFRKALAIFEQDPSCADPLLAARVVVGLLETLMLKGDYRDAGAVAAKFMPVVKQAGETPELVSAYYYQTLSLVQRYELRTAHALMTEALGAAERIGDGRARAYARAGLLHCRTRLGLDSLEEAERRKAELMEDCVKFGDNFLRNSAYFFVAWDYLYRGLIKDAREIAIRLAASGEASGDPRAIGFANWILGWINAIGGSPEAALAYADECLRVAIAPFDRLQGEIIRAVAAIFSGRPREGLAQIEALNAEFIRLGALNSVFEGPRGVALIETGRISEGIRLFEQMVAAREAAGDLSAAAFARILLAEVYIEILSGDRRAQTSVILRNLPTLAVARLRGARRASALLETAASHKQFSDGSAAIARIDFGRGQLFAMRGKRAQARSCFERARGVADAHGLDALRQRSELALARLA